ncbi:MAG: tectonin domain-containing protein [Candidatus Babeliales bacterium]
MKKNAPDYSGALNINDQIYIESIGVSSNYLSLQTDSIKYVTDKNLADLQILKFVSLQKGEEKKEEPKPEIKPKPGEERKPERPEKEKESPAEALMRQAAGFASLNGNFIKIALGMNTDNSPLLWALNAKGEIWEGKIKESTSGTGMEAVTKFNVDWQKKSDNGKWISVGTDGTRCALNAANIIYEFDGTTWTILGENFDKVSVGNKYEIWALKESESAIYKYDRASGSWQKIADGYTDLSVGGDGTVWAIKKDSRAARKLIGSDTWELSTGTNFIRIACGDSNDVWGITKDGAVWQNTNPTALLSGNYIQDNWNQVLSTKYEDVSVNSSGSVVILSSEKIEDNYPLYYKKGTGISIGQLLEKLGLLPEMTPSQALDLVSQKPESEKLGFYTRLVEWAKNNKKIFNENEQRDFVFVHLYPLYLNINKEADVDRKKLMQYQLMIILNNAKNYQPMVGIYAQPLEFSMIRPLQSVGILLPDMKEVKPVEPIKKPEQVKPVVPEKSKIPSTPRPRRTTVPRRR